MPRIKTWLMAARSDGVPRRSMVVALVVGTVLNSINQGDALLAGRSIVLWKLILTYLVPYCVATYGAVSLKLSQAGRSAPFFNDAHGSDT